MKRPVVLVVTRHTTRKKMLIDYVGEFHLQLLIRLRTLPIMVPVVEGTLGCLAGYREEMRGLLLVEGDDIEPRRYDHEEANFRYLEKTHPLKDEIEMRLLRHALRHDLPIMGICRGSQLLNVVYGGSLYGDVQKEKQSGLKHINPENYHEYRHLVRIVPGTPLEKWYRRPELRVNSYHHQGVRRLGAISSPWPAPKTGWWRLSTIRAADLSSAFSFIPNACWKNTKAIRACGKLSAPPCTKRRPLRVPSKESSPSEQRSHKTQKVAPRPVGVPSTRRFLRVLG